MKSLIDSPPRTMMEVFKQLPEGTLAELIDNQIYMSPSPLFNHQAVCKAILRKLLSAIEDKGKGQVFFAPFDVYLDEHTNAVQPDLFVVLNENSKIIDEKGHIHGSPDLVVEVLSKGNSDHDLIKKKQLYEQFAVKEYWIVDPDSRLAIGYRLDGKTYSRIAEDVGVINSPLTGISISF
jgi:Uma2 family endonuclease